MRIFISWSGDISRTIARSLKTWLPGVLQAAQPWMSETDIESGSRWTPSLSEQLEATHFGIICLTPENLSSIWIHFEAGALSKVLDKSRVIPYLFHVEPVDVVGPLAQFEAVHADAGGTRKLVTDLNAALQREDEAHLPDELLSQTFSLWWPRLDEDLKAVQLPSQFEPPPRSERELLEELLLTVRDIHSGSGRGLTDVLNSAMVNILLKSLYDRARERAVASGRSLPPEPPVITTGDLMYMSPDTLGELLREYFLLSIAAP